MRHYRPRSMPAIRPGTRRQGETHLVRPVVGLASGLLMLGAISAAATPPDARVASVLGVIGAEAPSEATMPILSATPATPTRFGRVTVLPASSMLILRGDIGFDTPRDLFDALAAYAGLSLLVLDSPGGFVSPALMVAYKVRELGLATSVPAGARCLSACAYVFFAGQRREVRGDLGVHQAFSPSVSDCGMVMCGREYHAMLAFGVAPEVLNLMQETPPERMHVFSPEEIVRYAINSAPAPAE